MALPATSSPSPPLSAHPEWTSEHTQHTHRNTAAGQKRRHDDVDESDTRSNIASGLKRLRIHPFPPLPQRTTNGAYSCQPGQIQPEDALPNSSAFPTSHPAYLQPQHLTPQPSPLHLTPGKGSLAHFLSPNTSSFERNYTNTPPPQSIASSSRTSTFNDMMTLDNPNIHTPHRIVINDLDAELAEIEAEEESERQKDQEQAFFLPDDVEKQINSIPEDVLRRDVTGTAGPPPSQALILYKDPASISVPEEEDAIRRAVREARARLRDANKSEGEPVAQREPLEPQQRAAPPWPGFQPIMHDVDDWEQQRRYQESAPHDWDDETRDEDAMEIG